MSYKEDILKAFLEFDPELVQQMEECNHAGEHSNPYHLEGSVYCHTLLTYNQSNKNNWMTLIMALCHDIGKVYTRQVRDNGRISFFGHAEASIQKTINFVHYLYEQSIISRYQLIKIINDGLGPMSNHTLYYQNTAKGKYICNGENAKLSNLKKMGQMDSTGSICKDSKITDNIEYKEFIARELNSEQPTVYIWSGVPGSGKDYLAARNGCPIVSFDDIRIKLFKENATADLSGYSSNQIYIEAFEYCKENNIDLMKVLVRDARDYLNKGISVNICNTSLTRKARRKIINSISSKYNYIVQQVFAPSQVIMKRNECRTSKTIPSSVINNMMLRMSICTNFEKGINGIVYIYND